MQINIHFPTALQLSSMSSVPTSFFYPVCVYSLYLIFLNYPTCLFSVHVLQVASLHVCIPFYVAITLHIVIHFNVAIILDISSGLFIYTKGVGNKQHASKVMSYCGIDLLYTSLHYNSIHTWTA